MGNTNRLKSTTLSTDGNVKVPSCPMRTATISVHAVVPSANPRILKRPRIVPMATANSRKISGAVEMIHLTLSMVAFPRVQFDCASIGFPGTGGTLDPDQSASGSRLRLFEPYRIRLSPRLDMSSLDIAASPPMRRDETVQVALLLAFAGGYLDAYIWIIHGVMANAQTANLVLLWVHGTVGEWEQAVHFIPPIAAFAVGVVIAAWLRPAP